MNRSKMFDAMAQIDEQLIERSLSRKNNRVHSTESKVVNKRNVFSLKKMFPVAVSLILIAAFSLSVVMIAFFYKLRIDEVLTEQALKVGFDTEKNQSVNGRTASFAHGRAYDTFDELIDKATDFVLAEYVGVEQTSTIPVYLFDVKEWICGTPVQGQLHVKDLQEGRNDVIVISGKEPEEEKIYRVGESYYLIVIACCDACADYDLYSVGGSLLLPADHLDQATMYGTALKNYTSSNLKKGQIKEYVQNRMMQSERVGTTVPAPFIRETDLETVLKESDYVLKVQITGKVEIKDLDLIAPERPLLYCRVTSILKGENLEEGTTIITPFRKGTVQEGETYILAMFEATGTEFHGTRFFNMSSRNSLFDETSIDQIQQILFS